MLRDTITSLIDFSYLVSAILVTVSDWQIETHCMSCTFSLCIC